jgi:hypothetical protein
MDAHRTFSSFALVVGLSLGVHAQEVGSRLPEELELEGYAQTGAKAWEDLYGRAVLLEFFAYW